MIDQKQSMYSKPGPYTMDEILPESGRNSSENVIENEYETVKPKARRNTQNERIKLKNQSLEQQIALLQQENQRLATHFQAREIDLEERALAEKSNHYALAFEGAAEQGDTTALANSMKDLVKTEALRTIYQTQKNMYASPPQQAPVYGQPVQQAPVMQQSFYNETQQANIDKLLNKFPFLDPMGDNPNYSAAMFETADRIQKDLLNEYQRAGRADEEFSAEFTREMENRLNNQFNGGGSSSKSSRMVAPVNNQNNRMNDNNVGFNAQDVALMKSFTNHFGEDFNEVIKDSFRTYKMHPEKCHDETLLQDMMAL